MLRIPCFKLDVLRTVLLSWVRLWAPLYDVLQDDIMDPSEGKLAHSLELELKIVFWHSDSWFKGAMIPQ